MNKDNTIPVLEPVYGNNTTAFQQDVPAIEIGSLPALEDLRSVGTRIRWGAILAGASLALGIFFLLGILGAAVGLSIRDTTNPTTLSNGAIAWTIVTTCTALFLGGLVSSVFTVGENKVEAMLYGIIMWAVLLAFFVGLGSAGVHTGFNSLAEMANAARSGTAAVSAESTTRVTWYAFIGCWLSMLAAAVGAVVGAGPTFRLVSVSSIGLLRKEAGSVNSRQRADSYPEVRRGS